MSVKINNVVELKAEIVRLKMLKAEQERYLTDQYALLSHKVQLPSRVLGAVVSSIPGSAIAKRFVASAMSPKKSDQSDWLSGTLRVGLPLMLNKTWLRNAGWLKKGLLLFASERAAGQINQDRVGAVISKVADFIRPKKKKKQHRDVASFEEEEIVDTPLSSNNDSY